jgi:hypothetical protein
MGPEITSALDFAMLSAYTTEEVKAISLVYYTAFDWCAIVG